MQKIILNTTDSALNRVVDNIDTNFQEIQQDVDVVGNSVSDVQDTVDSITVDQTAPANPSISSITESGYIVDGVLFSEVTVTYTSPSPLGNFKGVYFVVKNYRGSSQLVKEAEHNFSGAAGGTASFNVTLQRTNETITVYLVPKNNFGVSPQDWTTAPNTTVTLDGDASAPNAPSGLTGTATTVGIALTWTANTELNLAGYKVYRNTVNTFGTATLLNNIGVARAGAPSYFDATGSYVHVYFYWITAVNTAGQESTNSSSVSAISGGNAVTGIVAQGNFAAITSDTTITLYYDGTNLSNSFILRLADSTTVTVPTGSTAITGLTASTSYRFYPYYDVLLNSVQFVTGGSGSPAISFAASSSATTLSTASSLANSPGRIRLATPAFDVSTTAPASPPGGGGGGGGGDPDCLAPWMELETEEGFILAEDLEIGDSIRTPKGWSKVVKVKKPEQNILVKIRVASGAVLECSPLHPIGIADGNWRYAASVKLGDFLVTEDGASEVVDWQLVPMKYVSIHPSLHPYHEFYCNGILSHNRPMDKY